MSPYRGRKAHADSGILPNRTATVVHDDYATYFTYAHLRHATCNVHHLRDLCFIEECYQQAWASKLAALLLEIKQAVATAQQAGRNGLTTTQLANFIGHYQALLDQGDAENPTAPAPPPDHRKPKQSPPRNLLTRLRKYQTAVLAFMTDFTIPFDNNLAAPRVPGFAHGQTQTKSRRLFSHPSRRRPLLPGPFLSCHCPQASPLSSQCAR